MSRIQSYFSSPTIVGREDWSNKGVFNTGEHLTVDDILKLLEPITAKKQNKSWSGNTRLPGSALQFNQGLSH